MTDGNEILPISIVNCCDDSKPPSWIYNKESIPAANVEPKDKTMHLCLCIDDCSDLTKCGCRQLTLREASSYDSKCPTEAIGYSYRKLYGEVPTGVYECNSL